tara:strand:- start:1178 stop:1660 length:483 start_codon:yes stop_codon:yes gene_type:complete
MRARVIIFFIVIILAFIIFRLSDLFNTTIYSDFHEINKPEWLIEDTITFDFLEKQANLKDYNITIFGKTNQNYEYKNLHLYIDVFLENKKIKQDSLDIELYDDFGLPKQKNVGNALFFQLDYLNKFKFEKNKTYKFKIIHGMRDLNLSGVETLGLKINTN